MGPQGAGAGAATPSAASGLGSTLLWPTLEAKLSLLLSCPSVACLLSGLCSVPLCGSHLGLQGDQAVLGLPVSSLLYPQPTEPGTSPGGWTCPMLSPRVGEACWSRAALTLRGGQLDPPFPPPHGPCMGLVPLTWPGC
ncbi:tubulin beta-4B chain [Platysternon megacephalum]|uniref:Tubulin beta-4B chain n=1 Tax=Platysternon megacephalum TaxID=55544 RepID=A0A4D9E0J7_9SAUR|nr:tubulin beta-4B chain [Platysternon megacephalum]